MKTFKCLLIVALISIAGISFAKPYGTLIPPSPSTATLVIPHGTSCTDTTTGAECVDTDDGIKYTGDGASGTWVYYPFGDMTNGYVCTYDSSIKKIKCDTVAVVDTGPSPDCSGTSTYQDGEGNCDNVSGFVITCTDGQVLGTDCGSTHDLTNGFVVHIASGTVVLPAVSTGYFGCVKATTAATINVDPNASDRFILDGVALDDGDKLSSNAGIDETICFYVDSVSGWTTLFNPHIFTDGS